MGKIGRKTIKMEHRDDKEWLTLKERHDLNLNIVRRHGKKEGKISGASTVEDMDKADNSNLLWMNSDKKPE